jgi:hypothetical protein
MLDDFPESENLNTTHLLMSLSMNFACLGRSTTKYHEFNHFPADYETEGYLSLWLPHWMKLHFMPGQRTPSINVLTGF